MNEAIFNVKPNSLRGSWLVAFDAPMNLLFANQFQRFDELAASFTHLLRCAVVSTSLRQ